MFWQKTWIYLFIYVCPQKEEACQGLDFFFYFEFGTFLLLGFFEILFFELI